ncbi:MAG: ABC-2 transporter permease [Acidobacteriota bacterium]|jgi:hypothetical protein
MLNLVWKDVVAARLLLLAALPIYALNLAAMVSVPPIFVLISLLFSGALAFGSMVLDELGGTEPLWASLPVRRADIVFARYLTTIAGAALGLGISFGVERMVASFRETAGSALASAAGHLVLLLLLLLAAAVLLPLCLRLGPGNGSLAFSAIMVGGLLVLSLGGQGALWLLGRSNPLLDPGLYQGAPRTEQVREMAVWLDRHGPMLLGLASLITATALAISAGIARRLYEARDLDA